MGIMPCPGMLGLAIWMMQGAEYPLFLWGVCFRGQGQNCKGLLYTYCNGTGCSRARCLSVLLMSFRGWEMTWVPSVMIWAYIAAKLMLFGHVSGPWAMRDVAQITWALGMLAQPEPRYLEACQQAVARRMSQASVVDIINLMWAYAWLGTPPSAPCMQMHTVRVPTQSLLLGCALQSSDFSSAKPQEAKAKGSQGLALQPEQIAQAARITHQRVQNQDLEACLTTDSE